MLADCISVLFFLLTPALVIRLCRRVSLLGKIGPVLLLYILGMLFGNLFHPASMAKIQDLLTSATVPLSIPLLLFTCTFSRTGTRSGTLALITGMFAVVAAVVAGYFLFGKAIPDGAAIGGMLTGVYTGGTVNMAALKTILEVDDATFVLLNSYDMAICFLYLTFLMSVGIRFFRKVLPNEAHASCTEGDLKSAGTPFSSLLSRKGLREFGFIAGLDIAAVGISAGIALLFPESSFMTALIFSLTALGIAGSFLKRVRDNRYSYDSGMYLIYIFSLAVASMADFSKFDPKGSLMMLAYLTFVIFGSLFIQLILARIFRIDADTMTVSSVTYICSPPFVPMMAAAMNNRNVLASGLAIGVVGYAAGNWLGFLVARLLEIF